MTITPIIDRALFMGRIWITQLGIGFPEMGRVYLATAELLERIADAMAINLLCSEWEGQSAAANYTQGLEQKNILAALEEIDKSVAAVIEDQASWVVATRKSVLDTQDYLYKMKTAAEKFYSLGEEGEAMAVESVAAERANTSNNGALSTLADMTVGNTGVLSGLNERVAELVATLAAGATVNNGTLPAGNLQSVHALKNAAGILRVDVPSLMENAVFSFMTSRWLNQPASAVAGVSRMVGMTHGRYTDGFNDQLAIFEVRRAGLIQKVQADIEGRGSALKTVAEDFMMTDEEVAEFLSDL